MCWSDSYGRICRPYTRTITLVVLLQLVQTLATLYLPTLNADIIDNGVVKGDTGYILRIGGVMLARHAGADRLRRSAPSTSAPGPPWRSAATCGPPIFDRVQYFSAREVGQFGAPSLITRTTNDVQQVQMLVLMTFTLMVVGADHVRRRHRPGAAAGRAAVGAAAGRRAGAGRRRRR